jgi:hypothetical protein
MNTVSPKSFYNLFQAYLNQDPHPELVDRVCHCGESYLGHDLLNPLCPDCFSQWQVSDLGT